MSGLNLLLTLLAVIMICAGQVMFKMLGVRLHAGIPPNDWRIVWLGIAAMTIYGTATLLWIYVLRTAPLTKAYPYMALSFVLVPIVSVLLFSEQVRMQYVLGTVLIIVGVILTTVSTDV